MRVSRRSAYVRSGIGFGPLQHARMGIKNKSDDNKTALVALLTSILLGDGICASSKLALVSISTRSTSAEGREFSWSRLCRRWWHHRLSKWQPPMPRVAAGWHHGGSLFPVSKLSPVNTLHVLSQNTWQSITKFRWSISSYSSITIDDHRSSIWRLGCRWWHPGLSLWQLMVPPVIAELSGCRRSIFGDCTGSRYITTDLYMRV